MRPTRSLAVTKKTVDCLDLALQPCGYCFSSTWEYSTWRSKKVTMHHDLGKSMRRLIGKAQVLPGGV